MPKVYVVNKGAHDLTSARKFGELVYMTEGYQPKFAAGSALRRFQFCMQDSGPEDWLLLTGLSVLNCIAASVFTLKHGRLNLLLFNGKGYVQRTLLIGEQGESYENNL